MKIKPVVPTFDWEKFKDYVNTYDPKIHGLNIPETIIKDMIYGLGISSDEDEYLYVDGYKKFVEHLKEIITI